MGYRGDGESLRHRVRELQTKLDDTFAAQSARARTLHSKLVEVDGELRHARKSRVALEAENLKPWAIVELAAKSVEYSASTVTPIVPKLQPLERPKSASAGKGTVDDLRAQVEVMEAQLRALEYADVCRSLERQVGEKKRQLLAERATSRALKRGAPKRSAPAVSLVKDPTVGSIFTNLVVSAIVLVLAHLVFGRQLATFAACMAFFAAHYWQHWRP